jgi:release factor glutamine methyltransferase
MGEMKWRVLYAEAVDRLADRQAARWFVEEASGGDWPAVLDELVPARAGRVFGSLVERRVTGEPVQYVLGHWAFRKLDLMVDRRVLVPRPETEVVVEVALGELARLGAATPVVVDLGTGSGAIALSIASEHRTAQVWATDASEAALSVASANLAGLGAPAAGRARLVQGNWWEALPAALKGLVDLAVTNPPYVAASELADLPVEVSHWEPIEALVAGPSGLEALETILAEASSWLGPRSALVAEISPPQAAAATGLARRAGFNEVSIYPDLAGRDRALVARR